MNYTNKTEINVINKAKKNLENLHHIEKIARAMAPDPTVWEYQGTCIDAKGGQAHCACGHPIRWIFIIVNTQNNSTIPIGSSCIKSTVPYLITQGAQSLAKDLEIATKKLKKEIAKKTAAEIKRKRDHENNEKIQEMLVDLNSYIAWYNDYRKICNKHNKYIPYSMYRSIAIPGACKTPGCTIRRLKNTYRIWCNSWYYASKQQQKYDLSEYNEFPIPYIPTPKNAELLDILLNIGKEKKS